MKKRRYWTPSELEQLRAFMSACNACKDASSVVRADDGRERMAGDLYEYAHYLLGIYDK